jgi:hypothetical protein
MFADDTTLSQSGKSLDELLNKFKINFNIITDWVFHNKLIINYQKTNIMILTNKHISLPNQIIINNNSIEIVNTFKLLGVEIDNKLRFKNYVANLTLKLNRKLYSIKKLFYLNFNLKLQFFKSFILPLFDYCSSLFVYNCKTNINKLENLFNSIIKKLLNIDLSNVCYSEQLIMLSNFNILPFKMRLIYRFSLFYFKLFHKQFLKNLNVDLNFNISNIRMRNCNLQNQKIVNIKLTHTVSGEHSLTVFLGKFVNSIIKHSVNLDLKDFKCFILNNLHIFIDSFNNIL